jgi:hypothetical protein
MDRKYKRAIETLQKLEGKSLHDLISITPTKSLCFLNAGFAGVGGVSKDTLTKVLSGSRGVMRIEMTAGKVEIRTV